MFQFTCPDRISMPSALLPSTLVWNSTKWLWQQFQKWGWIQLLNRFSPPGFNLQPDAAWSIESANAWP